MYLNAEYSIYIVTTMETVNEPYTYNLYKDPNYYYAIPETPFIVKLLAGFMGALFLHHILKDTPLVALPDIMKRLLIQQLDSYFYKDKFIELEEGEEKKEKKEEEKIETPIVPYEEKYMDKFKQLNDELIFSEEELQEEAMQLEKIKQSIESNKAELRMKLAILETEYEEELNSEIQIQKKADQGDDEEPEDNDEEPEDNDKEEHRQLALKQMRVDLELLKALYEKPSPTEESMCELARTHIVNARLSKLKNNVLMEKTPLGNVVMFYNHERRSFEYYSDSTIPYRYLETVSRRYVVTYQCKCIYVDMMQQIKEAQDKLDEKKRKEEEKKEQEKREQEKEKEKTNELQGTTTTTNTKKDIFVKFKSYNKHTNISVASFPADRKSSMKQTKPQEEKIVKENANRYSYEGKLANFSFLKKVDRKAVDKRFAVSFAEFKKMQKSL
jgi:hypothetical protein